MGSHAWEDNQISKIGDRATFGAIPFGGVVLTETTTPPMHEGNYPNKGNNNSVQGEQLRTGRK